MRQAPTTRAAELTSPCPRQESYSCHSAPASTSLNLGHGEPPMLGCRGLQGCGYAGHIPVPARGHEMPGRGSWCKASSAPCCPGLTRLSPRCPPTIMVPTQSSPHSLSPALPLHPLPQAGDPSPDLLSGPPWIWGALAPAQHYVRLFVQGAILVVADVEPPGLSLPSQDNGTSWPCRGACRKLPAARAGAASAPGRAAGTGTHRPRPSGCWLGVSRGVCGTDVRTD